MRLTALRLAGFKSFVEPTEIRFPSELVGIVGPNGCGKSNILDAIRWVMGESSAKHLRGQSLDDVIFAGSSQRKPLAQASVELVFDNSARLLKGPWARPGEISVRRVLTRDGQSKYFLNGTRCRRKDIADLFLGTGLGARSYAIIEQGQINRLIEARPEELRATLEEAAGISRYKERRRETEESIQHTRENLARLDDLREELGHQLERLERQARTAERFRQLQAEEERLELALNALQLRRLREAQRAEEARLAEEEAGLLTTQAALHEGAMRLEQARAHEAASLEALHRAQAAAYAQGAEVARLEQALRHAREMRERIDQELRTLEQEAAMYARLEGEATEALARLLGERERAREGIAALETASLQARDRLHAAEAEALRARQTFEAAQARAQEPAQQIRVERTRLEQAERQQQTLLDRRQRLRIDQLETEVRRLEGELAEARAAFNAQALGAEALEQAQAELDAALRKARATLAAAEGAAEALRREEAGVAAELRALRALEQALISDESPTLRAWLKQQGLGDERAEAQVTPAPEWVTALDAVLGEALQAVPVDSLDAWRERAAEEGARGLWLVEKTPEPPTGNILHGDCAAALLGGLRPIESLAEALARRHELGPGEVWLTPQGEQVSRHAWRRPPASKAGSGTLARRLRLAEVESAHAALQPRLAEVQAMAQQARQALQELETRQATAQREAREILHRQGETATRVEQLRLRLEQAQGRLRGQRREQDEVAAELARVEAELEAHRQAVRTLTEAVREQEAALAEARAAREAAEQAIAQVREASRAAERDEQTARARLQTLERECELRTQQLEQHRVQAARLAERRTELTQRAQEAEDSLAGLMAELTTARAAETRASEALKRAQQDLAQAQEATRQAIEVHMGAQRMLEGMRRTVEGRRLTVQALILRAESPAAKVAEAGEEAATQAMAAFAGVDVEGCQARLEETRARITRLGAVNLAALEEFQEARQRKAQLDAQQADLTEALATLEAAIAKMDRETRGRFRATFDAVNAKLGESFQRLFGGGEAYLSLTADDWLEAGVQLMARPPGKKVSHIHLLSGGEKALTAIALVFAIFQLNPAPFCLLDEVDAPLDEANVSRFCAMVREMAERVQFIFITHNKTTMELARQLVGVTMREAGVSRIVAVDLDEAVRLVETRTQP
ncbi:MAG: chromosome segregation protein SMC [Gammaproteobacteria bacterium]|nr:chromosome segregation protein SMC [Gammaproteobacteria bacterium]